MQTTLNRLTSPVRSFTAGTTVGLFSMLVLCLCARAQAQAPIVVSGPPTQLGALTGGGWDGSQEPVGGTFVVGVNGNVLVGDGYTANFLQITPSGSDTTLAAGLGGSAAALDSFGNVYFGGNYNGNVYKLPYLAATGAYVGYTTAPTANCLGGDQDTAACIFAPAVSTFMNGLKGTSGNTGYAGMVFDAQGNFFFESNTLPGTNPNSIFECNLACIANSSATPTLIYADSKPIGALAIDPWGNIFFVDGNNSTGKVTSLSEIPLSSGSYASLRPSWSPTRTLLDIPTASAASQLPATARCTSPPTPTAFLPYPIRKRAALTCSHFYGCHAGRKGPCADSKGNLYGVPYSGGDVVSFIPMGSVPLGAEPVGTAATAVNATVFDNAASCTPALALSVTEFGAPTTEFTAVAGATCSTAFGAGSGVFSSGPLTAAAFSTFSVTANFTPTAVGERNAALIVKDTANSASGTVALTGVGQGPLANLDPGVTTAYNSGFTSPASMIADAAGDVFVADSSAGKVYEIPTGSSTPSAIGTGFVSPTALAFDANGNLFVADDGVPEIEEIWNTGVTGAFVRRNANNGCQRDKLLFGGTALATPMGLAVGPKGTLYISDSGNKRVVSYNPTTGQLTTTAASAANGLSSPMGVAVDSSGNLYVADTGVNEVFVFWSAGGFTTLAPAGISEAVGVTVDASGSVLVADKASGNIVRVPDLSGTLTVASAITIEQLPNPASSLWMDWAGHLYVPSASGKAAYAVQRSAASINLGTVQDGVTNSGTVDLMNAGNLAATLGTPDVTAPTNTMFSLVPATTNGCSNGTSGPAGASCQFTATFAPAVGTASGLQTGTATVNVTTPSLSLTVNLSGTASPSAIQAQNITAFTPPSNIIAGQQIALSATGGGSGNPVTFSIDPNSTCLTCATISGSTLTAVSAGSITVDANQAGGANGGLQYAAATQVQKSITIGNATAPGLPALLMTEQATLAAGLPNGGIYAGDNPAGTSFAVNAKGQVVVGTSYGDSITLYNPTTGVLSLLGPSWSTQPGGLAVDPNGNLYLSGLYSGFVAKLPFVNGAYAALSDPTGTAPPNCTGSDTAECLVASLTNQGSIGGIASMIFDANGDMFFATDDKGTHPFAIMECTAACLSSGTPAPAILFQEPTGGSPSTTGQLYIGAIALDPWGNIFFTDSNFINQTSNYNNASSYSDLYELAYTSATGYAATPTLLQTLTDASPGGYDDEIDAVAVTPSGTVYYGALYEGVFAIPNTQAGPQISAQYPVAAPASGSGVKSLTVDANGNLYELSSGLSELMVGSLTVPTAQLNGAPTTASATVVDNAFGCGTAATLAIASSNPEFSATAGTTCKSISAGGNFKSGVSASSYPATITFTATKPASQTGTLTISDTTNGGVGTATVTGFALTTPQALTFTAPTTTTYTYSPGMTIAVSVSNGGSNNPAVFTVDSTSSGTGTFSSTAVTGTTSSATLTLTQAGSIIIDANEPGGLANSIYYDPATQAQLTLNINQAPQTILFAPPSSPVTYAPGLTVTLSASGGGSGNTVVFSVDSSSTGAGTISGTTLTVTQAGNIVIDANEPGNVDYLAATQAQQSVVVNKATQTITFIPLSQPFHYIAAGATLSIQATGGASNSAIVFTLDKSSTMTGSFSTSTVSGATSTTTLTMPANQSPTSGTIVVDANQPANVNYAASTPAPTTFTITVLAPLPIQTITFPLPQTQVGGTTLTLTATASSGFPVTYTSSTSSACTVAGSVVTFPKVTSATTCTIIASQPGDNQYFAAALPVPVSFTVNPAGQVPAMNLNVSLPSLTIDPGTVGLAQITLTSQNNFTGTVTFACTGLPSGYTCAFNPNPVTIAENATGTTTLTVTPPATAAVVRPGVRPFFPATLAVALCFLGFRKRNRMHLLLLLVVLLTGLGFISACGGTSTTSTTKPVTSSITVTATSGSMQVSSPMTIIFE